MSLNGRTVAVNGIKFNVVVEGRGPSVLLLHGFPDSSYLWRNQIPALVDAGYQVIAPDQRGMGVSEAPLGKKNYTIRLLASDMIGLLRHLDIGRVQVVGHDWGAIVGWFLAMHHPELVQRYVAVSVGHPKAYLRAGLEQMLRAWYAVTFLVPGLTERIMPANNWRIMRNLMKGHPELEHWIADLSRPGRLTAGLNWYRANAIGMLREELPSVIIPTLGIWSSGDVYLSEKQMHSSQAYVDSSWQYERILGAGHWIPLEAPRQLNTLLLDFLKS